MGIAPVLTLPGSGSVRQAQVQDAATGWFLITVIVIIVLAVIGLLSLLRGG